MLVMVEAARMAARCGLVSFIAMMASSSAWMMMPFGEAGRWR